MARLTNEQLNSVLTEPAVLEILVDRLVDSVDNAQDIKSKIDELETWFDDAPRTEETKDTYSLCIYYLENRKKEAMAQAKKYQRLLMRRFRLLNPDAAPKDELDIDRAKEMPMTEIHTFDKLRQVSSSRSVALCPFHEEKTPSFVIFHKTNHAHCFGCGWHGDVIDLIQGVQQCDFVAAVKSLT